MKAARTWILIADGARARILFNAGPGKGLDALPGGVVHGDHASTHVIVSDRTGRTVSSTRPARAAIEAHSDPHRELKRNVAHRLADARAEGVDNRAYDRLIIVAAPSALALGALRPALCPDVRAKVTAEVAKDLTKTPDAAVARHLKEVPAACWAASIADAEPQGIDRDEHGRLRARNLSLMGAGVVVHRIP